MLLINPKSAGSAEMTLNKVTENKILLVLPKILLVSFKVPLVLMRITLEKMKISPGKMRITVLLFNFLGDFSGRNWNRNSNQLTFSNSWA